MPFYDYVCAQCGRTTEVMHGISDPGPAACPHCGGAMKKQISTPAIVFKGSGWAKKDARTTAARKNGTPEEASGGSDSEAASGDSAGDKAATPAADSATETASTGAPEKAKTTGDAATKSSSSGTGSSDAAKKTTPAKSGGSNKGAARDQG